MADDLGFEFFKSGKDHLESATKWQIILIAVLLYFHLGIVAPFSEKSVAQNRLNDDVAEKKDEQAALLPATTTGRAFATAVKSETDGVAEGLRARLVARFALLSEIVIQLRQMSPQEAAGQPGAQAFMPPIRPQHLQEQVQPYTGPVLRAMPEELRGYLSGAQELGEQALMTNDFIKYVRADVIQPAFDDANFGMREGALHTIADSAKAAQEAIKTAKEKAPKLDKELDALAQSVTSLRSQAEAFRFVQPEGDAWWRSAIGKEDTIAMMMSGLAEGVEATVKTMFTLEDLRTKADKALADEEASSLKLTAEIVSLKEETAKLQAQMGELAGPLKLLSFKLESTAPLLCMIVAVALAACAVWRAYGLQRMTEAVSLPKWGEQLGNMRAALKTAVGGTAIGLFQRQAGMLTILGGWIWLAFKATAALTPTISTNDTVAIVAVIVLGGARLWLWWCSHRALAAGSLAPPEPVAPASLADAST